MATAAKSAIYTVSGRLIDPLDPDPDHIDIEDIAHSLSNQCRFTGHTRFFYSVASHSVWVSRIVTPNRALWGLLHDASEAYLSDIARPIKNYGELGSIYKEVEENLTRAIAERFDLPWPMPKEIKAADDLLIVTEIKQLLPENFPVWMEPLDIPIDYTPPPKAKREFLLRYKELT